MIPTQKLLGGYMSADIEYGWGKLMSEMQLNAFINQYGIKGMSGQVC